jgi:heme/copper-type cytochrome/quinol oxidase subunit 3
LVIAGMSMPFANRLFVQNRPRAQFNATHGTGVILMWVSLLATLQALRAADLQPAAHSFAAVTYTLAVWQSLHVVFLTLSSVYTAARSLTGRLDPRRRVTFDTQRLLWHYTVWQGILVLLIVHSPRIVD